MIAIRRIVIGLTATMLLAVARSRRRDRGVARGLASAARVGHDVHADPEAGGRRRGRLADRHVLHRARSAATSDPASAAPGDALHLVGVNPATNTATMLNVPRDTCWQGDKINRAHGRSGPRGMANALGELVGVPVSYAMSVDFAGFQGLVDGMGGVQINVPFAMDDKYSGARLRPGDQRLNGGQALAFSRNRHDFPRQRHHAHRATRAC